MTRRFPLLLLACLCLIAAACNTAGPLPDNVAGPLRTPDGSEVELACPPSLTDADPEALATFLAEYMIATPSSLDAIKTLVPPEPPNSLRTVIPLESPVGPVDCCGGETNKDLGAPFGGGFATEEQLIQMGRLCGITADSVPALTMRVDLYTATAGAAYAYAREAEMMRPGDTRENVEPENKELLMSIGGERKLTRFVWIMNGQRLDVDDYELLFRRSNVVARIRLTYGSLHASGEGPPEPLLEYAAQLDRNIEAAALEQLR